MPPPGFQHRDEVSSMTTHDRPQPTRQFTPAEQRAIGEKLEKGLGPEYLSNRAAGGGQKVIYISGEKAINLANEVFGFNGWNTTIKDVMIDYIDEVKETGRISLGISVILRVSLKDGTFKEDIGYGSAENMKGKAMAIGKAKKEATTDALKRCLRQFGNVLGNCIYDKDYLKGIGKVKIGMPKFDEKRLHRHPDYAPKAQIQQRPPSNVGIEIVKKEVDIKVEELVPPPEDDDFGEEFFGDEFMDEDFESLMVDGVVVDSDGTDGSDGPVSRASNSSARAITSGAPETPVPNRTRSHSGMQQQPPQQQPQQPQQRQPPPQQAQQRPPPQPQQQANNRPPQQAPPPQQQNQQPPRMNPPQQQMPSHRPSLSGPRPMNRGQHPNQNQFGRPPPPQAQNQNGQQNNGAAPPVPQNTPPNQQQPGQPSKAGQPLSKDFSAPGETEPLPEIPVPLGFFSGRSADILQSATDAPVTPDRLARFNPVLLGVAGTPGVDHSRSSPIPRDAIKQRAAIYEANAKASDLSKELFPNANAPATYGSSRHLPFKAPTPMKRAAEPPTNGAGGRPALGQASDSGLNAQTGPAQKGGQPVQGGHAMAKRARH